MTYQHATLSPSENTTQALRKSYAKYNGDKIHDTNFQKSITSLLKTERIAPKTRYVQVKKNQKKTNQKNKNKKTTTYNYTNFI